MKPYLTDKKIGTPKHQPSNLGKGMGSTKLAKIIAANANRSGKKAKRQYEKLAIKNQVQEIYNEPIYQVEDILKESVEEDDLSEWQKKGLIPSNNELHEGNEIPISGHRRGVELEQLSEDKEEFNSSDRSEDNEGTRSVDDESKSSSESEPDSEGDGSDTDS